MKTIVYLDVDGVLNAVGDGAWPTQDKTGWLEKYWSRELINGYWIRWSQELVAALNLLSSREEVEFRWLTTWQDKAAELIAPALGLDGGGAWAVLTDPHEGARGWRGDKPVDGGSSWWKLDAIRQDVATLAEPVRIIWVDDDLPIFREAEAWAEELSGRTPAHHVVTIAPNTLTGLTRREVDIMSIYATGALDHNPYGFETDFAPPGSDDPGWHGAWGCTCGTSNTMSGFSKRSRLSAELLRDFADHMATGSERG